MPLKLSSSNERMEGRDLKRAYQFCAPRMIIPGDITQIING